MVQPLCTCTSLRRPFDGAFWSGRVTLELHQWAVRCPSIFWRQSRYSDLPEQSEEVERCPRMFRSSLQTVNCPRCGPLAARLGGAPQDAAPIQGLPHRPPNPWFAASRLMAAHPSGKKECGRVPALSSVLYRLPGDALILTSTLQRTSFARATLQSGHHAGLSGIKTSQSRIVRR